MLKFLIADHGESFRMALNERLGKQYELQMCADGVRALELLRQFRPDVLVLDLNLPGLDGLTILQQARIEGLNTLVLVTTRLVSDYILEKLQQLRVEYVLLKPCDIAVAVTRVLDLAEKAEHGGLPKRDRARMLSDMLRILGLSPALSGTTYVREAILSQSLDMNKAVTKELYPEVMCKYSVMQPELVERCIRNAVHKAWKERNDRVWRAYFPTDADGNVPRPSNRVFISRLAELLCLQDEQCQYRSDAENCEI